MIYVVMMKELATETITPVAAFNNYSDAKDWADRAILADDTCAFKVDTVNLNPETLAY